MIKLSNEKLVNRVQVINNLSQQALPITISYAIAKNIAKVEEELKIYNVEKQKLIEKYSIKGEDGKPEVSDTGTINIQEEFIEVCNKDFAELFAIENEINIHEISISKLENSNFSIAPGELMRIDFMITE